MNITFSELVQHVTELPKRSKDELLALISHQVQGDSVITLINERQSAHRHCPHCDSQEVKKHGFVGTRQRFRCKSCLRTFTSTYNSPFYRLRKVDACQDFMTCQLDSLSVRKTANRCGVNKNTAFRWRHRFLNNLTAQNETRLAGIVEIDETLFRYSEKGSRTMTRPPHKRGRDKAGRGRKKGDWVPVLVARDRENHVFDLKMETAQTDYLRNILGDKIKADSVVCSDSFLSYGLLCKQLKLAHKRLNFTKGIRILENVFHIQNVNGYHSRLHNWMGRFHGVATKYLENYLAWHRFFETHTNPNQNNLLLAQTQLTQT